MRSANGLASSALYDRTQEGIRLYKEGRVANLLFTGGPGDGAYSEADVMRRIALQAGVPDQAILPGDRGLNTRASAANCSSIMKKQGWASALVVSHYYHLARCKTAFTRAGVTAATVPATMPQRLRREPYYVLRECAAYLVYMVG